jgi:hypothetical protein
MKYAFILAFLSFCFQGYSAEIGEENRTETPFADQGTRSDSKEDWGKVKNEDPNNNNLKVNAQSLNIAYKVQCRYFATHDLSLRNLRSMENFEDKKEDIGKLDIISKALQLDIDNYCRKRNSNPESIAGSLLGKCLQGCRTNFNGFLSKATKIKYCENTCYDFTSPFQELSKAVIETINISNGPKKSADCDRDVNNLSRNNLKPNFLKQVEDVTKVAPK